MGADLAHSAPSAGGGSFPPGRYSGQPAADLHTHTTFSDGTTSARDNARLARDAGLHGLAITDHDTVAHFEAGAAACAEHDLLWIPGLELSCEEGPTSVHVLGYWVDPGDAALGEEIARLHGERDRRARVMIDRLREHGSGLGYEAVAARADGAPIGRPHLAAVMVALGEVADVQAAFDRWLADDGPVYEPKRALDPAEGVRLIRDAGGAAVLAHPGLTIDPAEADPEAPAPAVDLGLVDCMVAAGLAGLESDHAAHTPDVVRYWRDVARERGLLVTGASDFHGASKELRLGQRTTPMAVVEELRARTHRHPSSSGCRQVKEG